MNMIKLGFILPIVLLSACASTEVKQDQKKVQSLNDAQLKTLLVGKTMTGVHKGNIWTTTVKPDGTTTGYLGTKFQKGTYTIKNNLYCREWITRVSGISCWSMRKRTNDYYGKIVSGPSNSFKFNVK